MHTTTPTDRVRPGHRRLAKRAAALASMALIAGLIGVSPAAASHTGPQGVLFYESNGANPGERDIFVINANGSAQGQLTSKEGRNADPVLSPDGQRLAFSSDRNGVAEIFTMNPDGSNPVQITTTGARSKHPAWSPDGKSIAFTDRSAGNDDIWVVKASGGSATQLTTEAASDYHADWSPDGDLIAFTSFRDNNWEAYVMNADGSDQTNVSKSSSTGELDAVFTPGGDGLAMASNLAGGSEIFTLDLNAGQFDQVTSGSIRHRAPEYSPTGSHLTTTTESGSADILVLTASGTVVANLTNSSAYDIHASWGG